MSSLLSYILIVALLGLTYKVEAKNLVNYIAITKLVKGKATILPLGAHKAHDLKVNEKIKPDSSIVSSAGSLVRLEFVSGAVTTLGPNSKMVVQDTKAGSLSVVGLLQGEIRAKVEKDKNEGANNKQVKFLIKTPTSALGVRGTEFHAIYESKAKRTGLLTYEGEVVMAKIAPPGKEINPNGSILPTKSQSNINRNVEEELNKVTEVLIEKGQVAKVGDFASVDLKTIDSSKPVKIEPRQLVRLKNDASLGLEKSHLSEADLETEAKKVMEEYKKTMPENELKVIQEKFDQKENFNIVDLKTAQVIPVLENRKVDRGQFDTTNGQYIAPEGMKLDSVEGFVATTAIKKEEEKNT